MKRLWGYQEIEVIIPYPVVEDLLEDLSASVEDFIDNQCLC